MSKFEGRRKGNTRAGHSACNALEMSQSVPALELPGPFPIAAVTEVHILTCALVLFYLARSVYPLLHLFTPILVSQSHLRPQRRALARIHSLDCFFNSLFVLVRSLH